MNKYVEEGYVERVLINELYLEDWLVWYLFYYLVMYLLKLEKVWVVFDCVV